MSMSSKKDKKIAKAESELKRQQKKSGRPDDNTGERYVTGMEGFRAQGKGSKYRVIEGWYSEEMTAKFNKIFGRMQDDAEKLQEEFKENATITPTPKFDEKETK